MRVIAGSAKGRPLKTVKGRDIRPTADRVKESLFNVLGARVVDAVFLDLFAGSGNVGLEALSRGARHCVFVELMTQHLMVVEENLRATNLAANAELLRRDARGAAADLGNRGRQFDLIFIDPPYGKDLIAPVLAEIAANQLLTANGWIIAEHHKKDPVPDAVPSPGVAGGFVRFRELVFGETALSLYSSATTPTGRQSV